MPEIPKIPAIPSPAPSDPEAGLARAKARGYATKRRGYCDCGAKIVRAMTQSGRGSTEIGNDWYCPKCNQFQEQITAMDAKVLNDIPDPRPVELRGVRFSDKFKTLDREKRIVR